MKANYVIAYKFCPEEEQAKTAATISQNLMQYSLQIVAEDASYVQTTAAQLLMNLKSSVYQGVNEKAQMQFNTHLNELIEVAEQVYTWNSMTAELAQPIAELIFKVQMSQHRLLSIRR